MVIFTRDFNLNLPTRQRLNVPDKGDAFLFTPKMWLDGQPYTVAHELLKDGVHQDPDEFGRYNVNKQSTDGDKAVYELITGNQTHFFMDVEWYDAGATITDEGSGGGGGGVGSVNDVHPATPGGKLDVEPVRYCFVDSGVVKKDYINVEDFKNIFFTTPYGGTRLHDVKTPDRIAVTMSTLP